LGDPIIDPVSRFLTNERNSQVIRSLCSKVDC
jgi:hypothetical protein